MISDMLQDPTLPENLQSLTDELERLIRIVNNANMPAHLDTAENYLHQFERKWQLNSKKNPNAITVAIGNKIMDRRIELQILDMEDANNTRIKK